VRALEWYAESYDLELDERDEINSLVSWINQQEAKYRKQHKD